MIQKANFLLSVKHCQVCFFLNQEDILLLRPNAMCMEQHKYLIKKEKEIRNKYNVLHAAYDLPP